MLICALSSDSSSSSGSDARMWVLHGLALGAAAAAAAAAYLYRRPSGFRSRAVGIIPARFASTHFECKPLVHILGKPMIQSAAYGGWGSTPHTRAMMAHRHKLLIKTLVGDVNRKANPVEICHRLKRKTKKNVKVLYPDTPIKDHKQEAVHKVGTLHPLLHHYEVTCPGLWYHQEFNQAMRAYIRCGQDQRSRKIRDELKLKKLQKQVTVAKSELKQSMRVINGSKNALLESAFNQLKAYMNL